MKALHAYRHYMGVLFDRGERWKLVVAVLGSVLIALMDTASVLLVAPLTTALGNGWESGYSGRIANFFGLTTQYSTVLVCLLLVIGGFVLKDLLGILYSWWSLGFALSKQAEARMEITEYYMRLPYVQHADLGLGTLLRKTVSAVDQSYTAFAGSVLAIFTQVFTVALIAMGLVAAVPQMMIVLMLFLGTAAMLFLRSVKPLTARIGARQLECAQAGYEMTFDAFGSIKETQLRNSFAYYLDGISGPTHESARLSRVSGFLGTLPKQLMEILFMMGLGLAMLVSVVTGNAGSMLPSLAMVVAGAFRLLPAVAGLMGSLTNIRYAETGVREFVAAKQEFRSEHAVPPTVDKKTVTRVALTKDLVLDDVSFRYPNTTNLVLDSLSLTVAAGATVAFVGSSGAGKSTLLDVIMGLQRPTSGRMLVDGADIGHNVAGWQENIGLVPQEVFLTDRTIAENVAFDVPREEIDEAKVRHALGQADILPFVEASGGIWAEFGERGRRLSGGQRQRVGIARALYRDPSVLILDEATSALDNVTEARIAETIASLGSDVMCIMVAHRLSTIRDADTVFYLEDGHLAGSGTFDELRETSEGFHRLVELGAL